MVKKVAQDVFGELLETGKTAAQQAGKLPGQIIKSAGQQISGKQPSPQFPAGELKKEVVKPKIEPGVKGQDLLGKPLSPEKMNQLKRKDILARNKGLNQVRAQLGVEKIKRYQEWQQRIAEEGKKKEEIPEYEQAKTGYRTLKEKAEWLAEQRKKEEEAQKKKQGPLLPTSATGKMPGMDRMVKPKMGTKEMGKKTIG
jgi:hypothetical protein